MCISIVSHNNHTMSAIRDVTSIMYNICIIYNAQNLELYEDKSVLKKDKLCIKISAFPYKQFLKGFSFFSAIKLCT